MTHPVGIVAVEQMITEPGSVDRNDTELIVPVVTGALEQVGLERQQVQVWVSGSSDYVSGEPFSFTQAVNALGAWPPIAEMHLEMDGAWAVYYAWVRLLRGDVEVALVYSFSKASLGDIDRVLTLQLDPYIVAPLAPDATDVAALQARALLDSGRYVERDFAEVATRSLEGATAEELMDRPYVVSPLRAHDCPCRVNGAVAMVLASGRTAERLAERPAWIRAMDHRVEAGALGQRDLTASPSTALAAEKVGAVGADFDVAEIHAPYSSQELILRDQLRLRPGVAVNPSGGALANDPTMATGMIRIGEAASSILSGECRRSLAHATAGPCLQHNLVCVLGAN